MPSPTSRAVSTRRRSTPTMSAVRSMAFPYSSAKSPYSTTNRCSRRGASIKTWDDLLAAVKKLKAAGVTPMVMGGGEKWPMHFYWSYLLMRVGGSDVLNNAEAGKNGGFKAAAFVEAGKRLKELSDLQPYQEGWLSTLFPASTGMFGDGK